MSAGSAKVWIFLFVKKKKNYLKHDRVAWEASTPTAHSSRRALVLMRTWDDGDFCSITNIIGMWNIYGKKVTHNKEFSNSEELSIYSSEDTRMATALYHLVGDIRSFQRTTNC